MAPKRQTNAAGDQNGNAVPNKVQCEWCGKRCDLSMMSERNKKVCAVCSIAADERKARNHKMRTLRIDGFFDRKNAFLANMNS